MLWGSNAREAHPIFFHHVLKARPATARKADRRRPAPHPLRAVGGSLARASTSGRTSRSRTRSRARSSRQVSPTRSSSSARRPASRRSASRCEPWTLEEAERVTGVPADAIRELAHVLRPRRPSAALLDARHHRAPQRRRQRLRAHQPRRCSTRHVGRYGSGLQPLRGQNNVQGGGDMGALPNKLPGFQDVEDDAAPRDASRRHGARRSRRSEGCTCPACSRRWTRATLRARLRRSARTRRNRRPTRGTRSTSSRASTRWSCRTSS